MKKADFGVIVIGAGHAGCEAALASSRIGIDTLLLTINLDTVAQMPCNPSVGGQGKAHLVREIDALGGEMGIVADETCIHSRLLNTRKGLAVQAIRVQSDKLEYGKRMLRSLLSAKNLTIQQGTVAEILVENGKICGVETLAGKKYSADSVVLSAGTFLRGMIHIGSLSFPAGRAGEPPADELGNCLIKLGLPVKRFKTGTPPRILRESIDFSAMEEQAGEPLTPSFSLFSVNLPNKTLRSCFLTRTNEQTHSVIREHLHESALFSGKISGTGPRYCPSIEDKVRKFPEKNSHKTFLEPEGYDSPEIYLQGMSTSLPEKVQEEYVRTLPGCSNAKITRAGYAIEYDIVHPSMLLPSLESKIISGLFLCGQVNGTSGYEEAAAQGLLAGMNAALKCHNREPVILSSAVSYIGLLVEEIISVGLDEPYRIFTSRSQHRLNLRMSNAEERLADIAFSAGLINNERIAFYNARKLHIAEIIEVLKSTRHTYFVPDDNSENLHEKSESKHERSEDSFENSDNLPANSENMREIQPLSKKTSCSLFHFLKRPEVAYSDIKNILKSIPDMDTLAEIEIEALVKYEGYIAQAEKENTLLKNGLDIPLTENILNDPPVGISSEARQKIIKAKPATIGILEKLPGIRATDVALILMHLRK
ncbi:MAG: tRNA uridine-5-carboxymethylaminomethyl(34) synthesis enzyme MnmG [Candidatus Riflebacteria bacterium]|nr:tRNA uridine-5-carboxymethylaminomethyl(34) synthesis enzyme MnmG [Candidatus Riflebacteria bacterium]